MSAPPNCAGGELEHLRLRLRLPAGIHEARHHTRDASRTAFPVLLREPERRAVRPETVVLDGRNLRTTDNDILYALARICA